MALDSELEKLVGIPYQIDNGPDKLGMLDPWQDGVNCQFLAHWVLKLMTGKTLPQHLLSREIFLETVIFVNIISAAEATTGDIFIFGRPTEQDYRCLHLAVLASSDGNGENGNPLLIHATSVDGEVCFWPLSAFFCYPRYKRLFAIKRLNRKL